jgi:hypothetical protein
MEGQTQINLRPTAAAWEVGRMFDPISQQNVVVVKFAADGVVFVPKFDTESADAFAQAILAESAAAKIEVVRSIPDGLNGHHRPE